MQILDLGVIGGAKTFGFAGKGFSHIFYGFPFPVSDHVGMQAIAAAQLGNGLFALDRLQGNLGFELG